MKLSSYQQSFEEKGSPEPVEHYLGLNEIEGIYLMQHNFEGILEIVRNNGFVLYKRKRMEEVDPRPSTQTGTTSRKNRQGEDSLSMRIGTLVLNEMTQIKSRIQQSNYSIEMKDFLNLFLAYEVVYLRDQWKSDLETREKEEAYFKRYQLLDSNTCFCEKLCR